MTLNEAAKKWGMSVNWIRVLIRTKRVTATKDKSGPIPYYVIADSHPKPPSMRRWPHRANSAKKPPSEMSLYRREYRAGKRGKVAVKRAAATAAKLAPKRTTKK